MSETLLVALIVAAAALYAMWRVLPRTLKQRVLACLGWSQRLADTGGCGSCSSCKGCARSSPPQ